jgi:hypothetical protein
MPSKYTVLQYLPDPATGERVNIGIITYGEMAGHVRFLSRWDRVKAFAGGDITFLKDLSKEIVGRVEALTKAVTDKFVGSFDPTVIEVWMGRWSHGVEFTPPRASMLDSAQLLNDLCTRLLEEPTPDRRPGRDRTAAARVAAHSLRAALEDKIGDESEDLLKKNYRLAGKHQAHRFDAAVANGVPYVVASGISFEGPYSDRMETFYDSLAWAVTDVASSAQAIPVAVVALPPIPESDGYETQKTNFQHKAKLYSDLGAVFLTEDQYPDWAKETVDRLPFRFQRPHSRYRS